MKSLQVFALLFTDEGQPLANTKVRVEYFELAANAWTPVGNGATDAQGNLALKIAMASTDTAAPSLRLCEDGQGTRVLAQHAQFSYNARSQALICDFGQVERLDDTAYAFTPVQNLFSNSPLIFAGQSKRPNISTPPLMRALATSVSPAAAARATGFSISDAAVAAAVSAVNQPTASITSTAVASISADIFNAELIKFRAVEADLQLQIGAKERLILAKDAELTSVKNEAHNLKAETQNLKLTLEQVQKSEAQLKQENAVFVAENQRLSPIENIATNIGTQVAFANEKLRSEQKPYQIQNIQVELRGTLSQDGQAMNLLKMADLKEGLSAASLVKLDLVTTAPPPVQEPTSTVPDVTGFTESVARRLLKSVGLKMEMVSRSVGDNSQYVIGQAIAQSPAAGANAKHSDPVLVVFAMP